MTARTMKTSMNNLINAIEEMDRLAKTKQEKKATSLLKKRVAVTGELGCEYYFLEQIHLKNRKTNLSVTVPPSRRASL